MHPAHVAFEATKGGSYKTLAWTAGFTEYKVSFLCKDPQAISNWKELAGKSLVMPDPDSITSVITRAMLREQGLQEGAVKTTNTRYQDAVPFYVQNGFAAYGATASAGVVKAWKSTGGKTCAESRAGPDQAVARLEQARRDRGRHGARHPAGARAVGRRQARARHLDLHRLRRALGGRREDADDLARDLAPEPHHERRARRRGRQCGDRHPPPFGEQQAPSAAPVAMPMNMPTKSTALRRLRAPGSMP